MTLEIPIRWTSQSLSIQYVTKFYTISIFRFKINFLNSDTIKLFFFAAFAIDTWTATETVENSVNNHIRELNIQQFPLILARALKWVVALCPLGTADYFFFAIASESYVYNTNFLSPALERARQVCCRRFADCLTRSLSLSLSREPARFSSWNLHNCRRNSEYARAITYVCSCGGVKKKSSHNHETRSKIFTFVFL